MLQFGGHFYGLLVDPNALLQEVVLTAYLLCYLLKQQKEHFPQDTETSVPDKGDQFQCFTCWAYKIVYQVLLWILFLLWFLGNKSAFAWKIVPHYALFLFCVLSKGLQAALLQAWIVEKVVFLSPVIKDPLSFICVEVSSRKTNEFKPGYEETKHLMCLSLWYLICKACVIACQSSPEITSKRKTPSLLYILIVLTISFSEATSQRKLKPCVQQAFERDGKASRGSNGHVVGLKQRKIS